MNPPYFDHEKLNVYQKAVHFVGWADDLLQTIQVKANVKDHLDRASTSIVLNIAEGNGTYAPRERRHYFDIARGSTVECAACLDIIVVKKLVSEEAVLPAKEELHHILNMLMGLINRLANQIQEEAPEYIVDVFDSSSIRNEFEHEHEHE